MNEKIKSLFTTNGEIGRLDYLIYGLIIPIVILFTGFFILELGMGTIGGILGGILILSSIVIFIFSAVKRARNTKYNTTTTMILFFIPYIGFIIQLLLLFAPAGEKSSSSNSKTTIILIIIIVLLLGILAAVAIPKMEKTRQDAIEATLDKTISTPQ